MSQCLALVIDVGQRMFTEQVYIDDGAALITSDDANCPSALITFDSEAATVALHTSWVKTKVQNRLWITNISGWRSIATSESNQANRFTYLWNDLAVAILHTRSSTPNRRGNDLAQASKQSGGCTCTSCVQPYLHGADTRTILKAGGKRLLA